MIDIETLSTSPVAAVISVGVAVFNDTEVLDTNGWAVELSSLGEGHIDPGTLAWWMKQSEAAREFSFGGTHHPMSVLSELRPYLVDSDELWANDPDFDLVVLRHWWERLPRLGPWPSPDNKPLFRKYRSMRTMKALAKRYSIDISHVWAGKTSHNPIDDAAGQARAVIAVLQALDARHPEMLR